MIPKSASIAVVLAALIAGLITHAARAATEASPTGMYLRVVLSPYAVRGKPVGYQVQLGNASRGKDSSPATLRNVVLTMSLPHQSVDASSTLTGSGMAQSSYSRRFSISGVGGSTIEWRVATRHERGGRRRRPPLWELHRLRYGKDVEAPVVLPACPAPLARRSSSVSRRAP